MGTGTITMTVDEYGKMADELASLRKDAERIEWLSYQFRSCTVHMNGQHPWYPGHKLRELRGSTFREAIDAKIQEES